MASSIPLDLTLIVTAHNRADLVEETLSSLTDQVWTEGTWDVILVDNDSTDGTLEILECWLDKMPVAARIISATALHNVSYARAAGVDATDALNVVFVDDDDVLAPGFVAAIGEALRDHQFVGARHEHAQLNEPTTARYRGGFQTSELGDVFGVPLVSGGGFACRRTLWIELDGQSVAIGYGGEDADFSLRAHTLGITPAFAVDAVYHVRLRDGARSSWRQGRQFAEARVALYRLHRAIVDERPAPLRLTARRWAGLVLRLPHLRLRGPRLVWMWQLGGRMGHVKGSLTQRTWFL